MRRGMTDNNFYSDLIDDAVICFGCSFTSGIDVSENSLNWPYFLYLKDTNQRVVNFASPGSSFLYSVSLLEELCLMKKFTPKFVFFQITNPYRMTIKNKTLYEGEVIEHYKNFYCYDDDINQKNKITSGNMSEKWQENYFLAYDSDLSKHTHDRAQLIYIKHILKEIPHIIISQEVNKSVDQLITNNNISLPNVDLNVINFFGGHEEYNQYTVDNGMHLGKEGLKKQADILYSLMKKKLNEKDIVS